MFLRLALAVLLLVLPLLGGLGGIIARELPRGGPVYSVTAAMAGLLGHPQRWTGRTLLVRGEVVPCMTIPSAGGVLCAGLAPALSSSAAETMPLLPIMRAGAPPILVLLRQLPVVGGLLPAPQELRWGAVATYRVRLQAVPDSLCGAGECYQALLLDAAP